MKKNAGQSLMPKRLKSELDFIRKKYVAALKKKEKTPFDEWLCDNYYIFEREIRSGIKALKKDCCLLPQEKSNMPRIYEVCVDMCAFGTVPSEEEMLAQLSEIPLKSGEVQLLSYMLRCALLKIAVKSFDMQESEATELLSNAVKSFRSLPDIDFDELNEKLNPVEKILMLDPSGEYKSMTDETKSLYRHLISERARKLGSDEEKIAYEALEKARVGSEHIGKFLFDKESNSKKGIAMLVCEMTLPLLASAATAILTKEWYLLILLYLPFRAVLGGIIGLTRPLLTHTLPLPRINIKSKVPNNSKTLITVSVLLHGEDGASKMKEHLRELWQSNGGENTKICLLADLKNAGTPEKPEDKSQIAAVKRAVDDLNSSYSGGFILAVRGRVYSRTQGCFAGWERKRGAITQLVREIKGIGGGFSELYGDISDLRDFKYILALDSDTSLPLETVQGLVSVAIHPCNRPVIDKVSGIVTSGHAVLSPAVGVNIGSASTAFAKTMAGDFGVTAYDTVSAERYQDFFDESIFAGKGLIDVDAFYTLLDNTLPQEKILSHDILEGCYLRCGYVSDIQVTDGFPKSANAYYDRMERWIRGDMQNSGYVFGKNPLSAISRYKLLDNVLRSLTPVFSMLSIGLLPFMGGGASAVTAAVCVFAAASGNFLSALRTTLFGGSSMFSRLFYSSAMPAALADLVRGVALAAMLPLTAWISLCAVLRAAWRIKVSKKHLLDWTTFAQSDNGKNTGKLLLRCLPSFLVSVLLVIFPVAAARLCALLFLAGIPFLLFSGKQGEQKKINLSFFERDRLISYAAGMWKYFEELCTVKNNYLPPDNMQETPVFRTAPRTSPTNIGLMLLCTLAARDMGFIDSTELCTRLNRSISTIEKLEKRSGNLLNWYDTRNLKPLFPRYLSCVDSGNFLCCLTALKQGVAEYKHENEALGRIADRIEKLISDTDLTVFYNERRRLFHIGIDLEKNELSPSYYDLLMSEARMTGYFAVASKSVPKKHWGTLGRTLVGAGRYIGLVSWTGTMFEYFMPNIFLPAPQGTLCYEALKFCAWCQKNRASARGASGSVPWGVSESGFYAFDKQLNYQYKAHGVQKLGLKRGLNSEFVVSPYSSFLVLPIEPKSAMKNLKLLEDMEMTGRCGFYEAADFTKTRTNGQDYAVVRSYMAHHVGMSMLCILNALKGNIIQKRFMSDERMASGVELLNEKIPSGAPVFKDVEMRSVPKTREHIEPQKREFEVITPTSPHVKLLTNGEWTAAVTDVGASMSMYSGASVLRHDTDLLRKAQGVIALLKGDGFVLPATSAPFYPHDVDFKCEFTNRDVIHTAEKDEIRLSMRTCVHPRLAAEQRTFVIRNKRQSGMLNCDLIIYFEPWLTSVREANAHPAFSKLFVVDSYDSANEIVTFTRRARGEGQALSLAAGFLESIIYDYETSKRRLLKSGIGVASLLSDDLQFSGSGGVPDACSAFRIKVKLPPKGTAEISLLLAAASTASEAGNKLLKLRETGGIRQGKGASELLREGGMEAVIGDAVVPCILYEAKATRESADAVIKNTLDKKALWTFGVSGDYPIVYIEVHNASDSARAVPYIRLTDRLRGAGILSELVIAYREGGEYDTPILSAIRDTFANEKAENLLEGGCGAHIVNLLNYSNEEATALRAAAVYIAPKTNERLNRHETRFVPISFSEVSSQRHRNNTNNVRLYNFTDNSIIIGEGGIKPCVPWSNVLANRSFGTIVSDKSLGFTWAINSHENKLTPWNNDASEDNDGELLVLKFRDKNYNLLLNSVAEFTPNYAKWRGKAGEVEYEVTVTVPDRGMVKNCSVKLKNRSSVQLKMCLIYYTEPVLGADKTDERLVLSEKKDDGILLKSYYSEIRGFSFLSVDGKADYFCTDRENFFRTDAVSIKGEYHYVKCAAVGKNLWLGQDEEATVNFHLSWAATSLAATMMPFVQKTDKHTNFLTISTPDKAIDRMANIWLEHQILSSRLLGRTGFYQCGGAWGFRDQLQDASALIFSHPRLVKQHIFRCCAVQFEQGDVLHWWHRIPGKNGGVRGVRTRYSDDLLWLPLVVSEYVEKTGDYGILDVEIYFLCGDELSSDESERYFMPELSREKGSVYEHCVRAVHRSMNTGEHGLLLIGGGDWNDGFNKIGAGGKGESVWLTQFAAIVMRKMFELCREKNEIDRGEYYREYAQSLLKAVDNSWDGEKYIRAYFDDGTPLGKSPSSECETDSLPQSFAVFSDMLDRERVNKALDTAIERLVDKQNGIIKLLSPPFSGHGIDAGYITAYPPGIRENGGQYTHAAVWLCMALLRANRTQEGIELLKMLNPSEFCENPQRMSVYLAEPYALAGDISANEANKGCIGWSLYTGAASWFYRAIIEELFGIRIKNNKIFVNPKLTADYVPAQAIFTTGNTTLDIEIKSATPKRMIVDGEESIFVSVDGKNHSVVLD